MDRRNLKQEWDETPEKGILPLAVKKRMWKNIRRQTLSSRATTYKYAAAACMLFFISLVGYNALKQTAVDANPMTLTQTVPDEIRLLRLSDGTRIWVNQNTQIRYPSRFSGNTREIMLNGEAFFEVAKDSARPFIITSGAITTTVLGTSFSVKAYDLNRPQVSVRTGKVKVATLHNSVYLERGDAAMYLDDNKFIRKTKASAMEPEWKKILLDIDGLKLGQLMDELQNDHNFSIQYATNDIKELKIEGSLDTRLPPSEMLQSIAFALQLNIEEKSLNTFVISRQ